MPRDNALLNTGHIQGELEYLFVEDFVIRFSNAISYPFIGRLWDTYCMSGIGNIIVNSQAENVPYVYILPRESYETTTSCAKLGKEW